MNFPKSTEIKAKDYKLINYGLHQGFLHKSFHTQRRTPHRQVNVFSKGWVFATSYLKQGQLSVRHGQDYFELNEGLWGLLIPSYSILDWKINIGNFELRTLTSRVSLPIKLEKMQYPIGFSISPENFNFPNNELEVYEIMNSIKNIMTIAKDKTPSQLAKRTRAYIIQNFMNDLSITQIADQFQTSREVLSRKFSEAYGISPIRYRNGLRSDEAIRKIMLDNENITHAGMNSGFSDISVFNRQFKSSFELPPKAFKK